MSGQLIPPPELDPPFEKRLNIEERLAAWIDVMKLGDELVLASLRRKIGPHGDLRAAYREWYADWVEGHDRMMLNMLKELARREGGGS